MSLTNKQENKNDRGDLEQPQSVSCGNQALTLSQPPCASPTSNSSNYSTTAAHQLPISASPFTFDDQNSVAVPKLTVGRLNDDELSMIVDSLADEESCLENSKRQRPAINCVFSDEPASFELCIGTQTESHENDLAYQSSTEDLSDDLLSHVSEKDYDYDNDDFYKDGKVETSFTKLSTAAGTGTEQDDEFVNGVAAVVDENDQPTKGLIYYIVHTVLMTGNMYAAQQLFKHADHVAIMQLTFVRGVVCSFLVLLMVNRNLKSTLWDPVDCKTMPSLIFRCLQGGISVYISFSSINYFNVSTVGIVCSLKPIIACLFGISILGERMGCRDVVCMSAVFIAVFLVIAGGSGSSNSDSNTLALVALVAQPFLLAGGDIAMRKMRKMPEQLCSAYQNLTLSLLAALYMLATGLSFDFIWTLSNEAWMYLVISCSLTILTQLAKASAFRYSESSRLQKLSFLPNVWQFAIDLLILSVLFTKMQFIGFGLLITFYMVEMTYSVVQNRMANKKQFVANDDGYTKL